MRTKSLKGGWKPGAISNRLLKKLNKVKRQTQPEQGVKPKKKAKKRIEDKPTLIISKKNGEYRVEMQVSPEDSELNVDHCSPLIYRIGREDTEERIQKRLRRQQRLVKEAVGKVWVDPYHPEICEKTCLRAYKEAVGLADPNKPECTCTVVAEEEDVCSCCNSVEEDDDTSECSSLDLEWEIHFSPPIASHG